MIRDDSVARMLGQFTLRTIASFGMAPRGERVAELVAEGRANGGPHRAPESGGTAVGDRGSLTMGGEP